MRQQQLDHQEERHIERRREPRGVAPSHFHCFPNPVQLSIERWQPVASFSVRVTIGVAPALLAVSVSLPSSPAARQSVYYLVPPLCSWRRRERAAYNPQSSFLASELTSHTRRRPTPSAAHDSLTHEAEEARLPVWQLGPLQDGEHLPPRDARLGRRRTGRLRATQAERGASATAGRVGFKA